jgi:hypothetical protein
MVISENTLERLQDSITQMDLADRVQAKDPKQAFKIAKAAYQQINLFTEQVPDPAHQAAYEAEAYRRLGKENATKS